MIFQLGLGFSNFDKKVWKFRVEITWTSLIGSSDSETFDSKLSKLNQVTLNLLNLSTRNFQTSVSKLSKLYQVTLNLLNLSTRNFQTSLSNIQNSIRWLSNSQMFRLETLESSLSWLYHFWIFRVETFITPSTETSFSESFDPKLWGFH